MKRVVFLIIAVVILLISSDTVSAQNSVNPEGSIVYALPNTTFNIEAEAVRESYIAGPYAKYAAKYLGVDVKTEDATTYELVSIKVTPCVEADQSQRYIINLAGMNDIAPLNFFTMSSQGVLMFADNVGNSEAGWRFPPLRGNDNSVVAPGSNLTNMETTLYKSVKTSSGHEKVPISQTQVVQKSVERKAQETAEVIFSLRTKRTQIITGDTDATFSGEAMKAVIDEINRLESEYLSLFLGKTEQTVQKMSFDVVPNSENVRHIYIAFRISDTQGLLPANVMSGRPVILELAPQIELTVNDPVVQSATESKNRVAAKKNADVLLYRTPAVCELKILDGTQVLLQSRVQVYQLGEINSFPAHILVK